MEEEADDPRWDENEWKEQERWERAEWVFVLFLLVVAALAGGFALAFVIDGFHKWFD